MRGVARPNSSANSLPALGYSRSFGDAREHGCLLSLLRSELTSPQPIGSPLPPHLRILPSPSAAHSPIPFPAFDQRTRRVSSPCSSWAHSPLQCFSAGSCPQSRKPQTSCSCLTKHRQR